MSMVWIQLGTCSIWWLSVRAAMTFRAPGGLVGGHGVQPSVMTTMASGLVSAAACDAGAHVGAACAFEPYLVAVVYLLVAVDVGVYR